VRTSDGDPLAEIVWIPSGTISWPRRSETPAWRKLVRNDVGARRGKRPSIQRATAAAPAAKTTRNALRFRPLSLRRP
jgi:hypothetical protein